MTALQSAITETEMALISIRAAMDADTPVRALEWLAEADAELARASVALEHAAGDA